MNVAKRSAIGQHPLLDDIGILHEDVARLNIWSFALSPSFVESVVSRLFR